VKILYHPAARAELLAAAEWYESRRPSLGEDFHIEVSRAEALIGLRPATWPRWPDLTADVRRFTLVRFPFSLAYQVVGEEIVLLAVAHQRRAPFYWQERARET
jgi:plasmid stabilization system protein ParE